VNTQLALINGESTALPIIRDVNLSKHDSFDPEIYNGMNLLFPERYCGTGSEQNHVIKRILDALSGRLDEEPAAA